MHKHLNSVRWPRSSLGSWPPLLHFHRHQRPIAELDSVHDRHDAEFDVLDPDRPDLSHQFCERGVGKAPNRLVHSSVGVPTFLGVATIRPTVIHPLEVEQAWTVDELVEHPSWEQVRLTSSDQAHRNSTRTLDGLKLP